MTHTLLTMQMLLACLSLFGCACHQAAQGSWSSDAEAEMNKIFDALVVPPSEAPSEAYVAATEWVMEAQDQVQIEMILAHFGDERSSPLVVAAGNTSGRDFTVGDALFFLMIYKIIQNTRKEAFNFMPPYFHRPDALVLWAKSHNYDLTRMQEQYILDKNASVPPK